MTTCSQISSYLFADNTAGSCSTGFFFHSKSFNFEEECPAAKGVSAYASEVGLMVDLVTSQLMISEMVFADNRMAVNFNILNLQSQNKLIFIDSYVAGISRANCPNCYNQYKLKNCQQASGLFISSSSSSSATSINTSISAEIQVNNVLFEDFFFLNPNLSYCSQMSIFGRPNSNNSITSSFFLKNTSAQNCQNQSWANFQLTSVETQQCRTEPCFGSNNNCFIFDQDGAFTGLVSQILSNKSAIGDNEPACQNIPFTNSHWCHTNSFTVLEFQSDFWDQGEGEIWPASVNY